MALYDADTITADRTSPQPQFGDTLPDAARMAHGTTSSSYQAPDATTRGLRMVMTNNALVWYDGSNNVTSYYGILSSVSSVPIQIIAKPGKDVFTDILGISRPSGL